MRFQSLSQVKVWLRLGRRRPRTGKLLTLSQGKGRV
jgi:hypothetical protein